jgi:hypothetical protein
LCRTAYRPEDVNAQLEGMDSCNAVQDEPICEKILGAVRG